MMKNVFSEGATKTFIKQVLPEEIATFESGNVHPVYATFALARDAEWVCRLFVLDMKEEDEEGIGTMISVEHLSPALVGSEVVFTATLLNIKGNAVTCSYEAKVGERLIARGTNGQKILKREKINSLFESLVKS